MQTINHIFVHIAMKRVVKTTEPRRIKTEHFVLISTAFTPLLAHYFQFSGQVSSSPFPAALGGCCQKQKQQIDGGGL